MNILLLNDDDYTGDGRVQISGSRARHIRDILKTAPGESLRCGHLGGRRGQAQLLSIGEQLEFRITLDQPPPDKLPLTLLLALPRPKAARRLLRTATEMGVSHIILLNSYRVEKSYWQSPLVDDAHLHAAMLEGLEQSGDTVLPTLQRARLFKPFVEDELPALLQHRRGLVAHPYSEMAAPAAIQGEAVLVIGPEGGFIPYEVDKLVHAGCETFHLGQRILRVETAVPALISKLYY